MNLFTLNGKWTLSSRDGQIECPAAVPGDNYTALEGAGLLPNPYYRLNESSCQWPAEKDWVFSRTFDVPLALLSHPSVILNFDSVDTVADIVLNGCLVAPVANEFRRWRLEVKPFLKEKGNRLEVRIRSVAGAIADDEKAHPHIKAQSFGCNTLHQIERLRKCQCSSGWDWGISLPVSGIYGDTYLLGADTATLDYAWDEQRHSRGAVGVFLTAELRPVAAACAGDALDVVFSFNGETKTVRAAVPRDCGPFRVTAEFTVRDPELWWPNGLGPQTLHAFSVTADGQTIEKKIGLRTLELVREKDGTGETFGFRVNGVDVFAKGANWIPCEAHPSRRTGERYTYLLQSMADANMNMVRVWGGGLYEPDFFYEECDRLGILVWQDMMFACGLYPDWRAFQDNVRDEIRHQILRLRSHPSIALWCGDNENLSCSWVTRSEYALVDRLNCVEKDAIAEADPTRAYWPSSPCAGDRVYDDNFNRDIGDTHLWGVPHGDRKLDGYLATRARFISEYGFGSFPSAGSTATFAEPGDLNVSSPVMEAHVKKDGATAGFLAMISNYFTMPEDFASTVRLSEVKQAYALQTVTENWHAQMPYTRGTLYWQLNQWWPVSDWSTVEHHGRWKPAHYALRRIFAPLTASLSPAGQGARRFFRIVWDLPDRLDAEIRVSVRALDDGREVASFGTKAKFSGAGVKVVRLPDFTSDQKARGGLAANACFAIVDVRGKDAQGRAYAFTDAVFAEVFKNCNLPEPRLKIESVKSRRDGTFEITVSANKPAFFTWLEVADDPLGRFDDNLVALLPGKSVFHYKPGRKMTVGDFRRRIALSHL